MQSADKWWKSELSGFKEQDMLDLAEILIEGHSGDILSPNALDGFPTLERWTEDECKLDVNSREFLKVYECPKFMQRWGADPSLIPRSTPSHNTPTPTAAAAAVTQLVAQAPQPEELPTSDAEAVNAQVSLAHSKSFALLSRAAPPSLEHPFSHPCPEEWPSYQLQTREEIGEQVAEDTGKRWRQFPPCHVQAASRAQHSNSLADRNADVEMHNDSSQSTTTTIPQPPLPAAQNPARHNSGRFNHSAMGLAHSNPSLPRTGVTGAGFGYNMSPPSFYPPWLDDGICLRTNHSITTCMGNMP
ncbi:hypothetical protein CC2G_007560 [Coprinopsis cinerea AmutBmut pab1-1]|nr:hypothetical protein CC2G_007560 [Coprinopsis cinerea AmutBmut pab1-1]